MVKKFTMVSGFLMVFAYYHYVSRTVLTSIYTSKLYMNKREKRHDTEHNYPAITNVFDGNCKITFGSIRWVHEEA